MSKPSHSPSATEPALAEEPAVAEQEGTDLVELVLADSAMRSRERPSRIEGVVVGAFMGFSEKREALIEYPPGDGRSVVARSTVALSDADLGREVALLFEGGDPEKPILMGLMHMPSEVVEEVAAPEEQPEPPSPEVEVTRDGERVVLSASKEIVLRCGKASITLTRAGKIIIRGAYLLARSSGVNRIQGGSVQIN